MDIQKIVIAVPPILIAVTFHEVAHGFIANRLGDPTARFMGRLSFNPIKHIDPVGTVLIPIILTIMGGVIFGYAKPVPINPSNFKDPKKGMAISSAAGPITNIVLAIISSFILMIVIIPALSFLDSSIVNALLVPVAFMLAFSVHINILLAALNLIPILPLDGGRVLVGLLPYRQAAAYSKIEPYGLLILLALIFTGIAWKFIVPVYLLISKLVPFFNKIVSIFPDIFR